MPTPRLRYLGGSLRMMTALASLVALSQGVTPTPTRALPALPPVSMPVFPSQVVVDPGSGHVFVSGPVTDGPDGPKGGVVRTFDGDTGALLARTTLSDVPQQLALDPMAAGQVLVMEADGRVEALDTRTGALRHLIAQPLFPPRVALDAQTGRRFELQGDAVRVVDVRSGATLRNVPVEVNPIGIVVDSSGGKVLVASHGPDSREYQCQGCGGSVAVLDPVSGAVLATNHFPDASTATGGAYADQGPTALAFDVAHRRLYVSRAEGLISVFDTTSGKLLRDVPGTGGTIALDPLTGTLALTGNFGERTTPAMGTVALLDPATGKLLGMLTLPGRISAPVLDGVRHRLYLIHSNDTRDEIVSIDTRDGGEVRTYALPDGAVYLALDPLRGHLYPDGGEVDGTPGSTRLTIVPVAALEPAPGSVSLAGSPVAVAVDPAAGHAFVASTGAPDRSGSPGPGTVTMLDSITGSVLATIPIGVDPGALAVDARLGRVYVAAVSGSSGGASAPLLTILDARSGAPLARLGMDTGDLQVDEASGHLFFLQYNNLAPPPLPGASGPHLPDNALVSLDASGAVLHSTPLPNLIPRLLLLDQRAGVAYVGTDSCRMPCAAAITAIDERTGAVLRAIVLPLGVQALALDPVTGHVIATHTDEVTAPGPFRQMTTVSIIDPRTGTILHAATLSFGTGSMVALTTRFGARIYLAAYPDGAPDVVAVAILDAATGQLLARHAVPGPPLLLDGDSGLGRVHVLMEGGAVATLDSASGWVLAVTPVGTVSAEDASTHSQLLGLDAQDGRLFVVSPDGHSVGVLDARSGGPALPSRHMP